MKSLVLNPEYGLYERGGHPFCSSRQVAETFEKDHARVLRDVREMGCSEKFRLGNFAESSYLNEQRKKQPEILMTRDGFSLLVMGYTGKKAMVFKEAYIERFNKMEAFIKSLLAAKMEHPAFTEAVMLAHEEPKHYHYSNEADMINRIVLGVPAKVFREQHGIEAGKSIRPYLSAQQIADVERLQRMDIGLLAINIPFDERRRVLTEAHEKIQQRIRSVRLELTK